MAFKLAMKTATGDDVSYHNFKHFNVDTENGNVCVIRKSWTDQATKEAGFDPKETKQETVLTMDSFPAVEDAEAISGPNRTAKQIYTALKATEKWSQAVDC